MNSHIYPSNDAALAADVQDVASEREDDESSAAGDGGQEVKEPDVGMLGGQEVKEPDVGMLDGKVTNRSLHDAGITPDRGHETKKLKASGVNDLVAGDSGKALPAFFGSEEKVEPQVASGTLDEATSSAVQGLASTAAQAAFAGEKEEAKDNRIAQLEQELQVARDAQVHGEMKQETTLRELGARTVEAAGAEEARLEAVQANIALEGLRQLQADKAKSNRSMGMDQLLQYLLLQQDYAGAARVLKTKEELQQHDEAKEEVVLGGVRQHEAEEEKGRCYAEQVKSNRRTELDQELQAFLSEKDYAGAARVQEEKTELAAKAKSDTVRAGSNRMELDQELQTYLAREDYAGAARVQEEVKEMARRTAEEAHAGMQQAYRTQLSNLDHELKTFLVKENYAGAARVQAEHKEVASELASLKAERQTCEEEMLKAAVPSSAGPRQAMTRQATTARSASVPPGWKHWADDLSGQVGECVDIEDLFDSKKVLPGRVLLKDIRVLSLSKVGQVPQRGKGKGKDKGKDKGKGKGKDKGKDKPMEPCQTVYLGKDGYVLTTVAFGDDVSRIALTLEGSLVTAAALHPRFGEMGVLHWTGDTVLTQKLEPHHLSIPMEFPYDTTAITDGFATWQHVQTMRLNDYAALVLKVISVVEKATMAQGEPYLEIYGADMDGARVGALRLWRWEEGDICCGEVYILRGLRVQHEQVWCPETWKWVPRTDGSLTLECGIRTAAERVSHVAAISTFF